MGVCLYFFLIDDPTYLRLVQFIENKIQLTRRFSLEFAIFTMLLLLFYIFPTNWHHHENSASARVDEKIMKNW